MALLRRFGQGGRRCAPRHGRSQRLAHGEPRAQAVFVETVTGPGAAKPDTALALDFAEPLLRREGGRIILRMFANICPESKLGIRFERRIKADEQWPAPVDTLEFVHPIGHGDVIRGLSLAGPAKEIPRSPSMPPFGHQFDV